MSNLLISGDTNDLQDWDIQDTLKLKSRKQDRDRMTEYAWENYIGPYCGGMTYLEIQQFDNLYNNFN